MSWLYEWCVVIGWAVGLLGGVVLIWGCTGRVRALRRWQKSAGAGTCKSCGYDLTGIRKPERAGEAGPTCPECGCDQARPRVRRPGWSVIAGTMLIVFGVQCAEQRERWGEGATRWIPSTVLVLLADVKGDGWRDVLFGALWRREGSLAAWQGAIVAWREGAVNETVLRSAVVTRAMWRDGEEVDLWLRPAATLRPSLGGREITAYARIGHERQEMRDWEHAPYPFFVCGGGGSRDTTHGHFRSPGVGEHRAEVKIQAIRRIGAYESLERDVRQDVDVRVVAELPEGLPMRASDKVEELVRSELAAYWMDEGKVTVLWSPLRQEPMPCALQLTVLHEGAEVDTLVLQDGRGTLEWNWKGVSTNTTPEEQRATVRAMRVRITGDAKSSMRVPGATWCWSGSVETTMGSLLDRGDGAARETQAVQAKRPG